MKAKIILMIVWTSFCKCDRQHRSTVLTDESKRVVEHFDFSNFDKQEALNYIDRQRYENQIRGKRSQAKSKRDHNNNNSQNISDVEIEPKSLEENEESNTGLKSDSRSETLRNYLPESPYPVCKSRHDPTEAANRSSRSRHGNGTRKKHKYKSAHYERNKGEDEEHKENVKSYRKKKAKKKKKKKRKKRRHYWDNWSEWSPCSVTCGRGRKIRWRKCLVKNCRNGELEMGEKTCQLPACNLLTKLLGIGSH